MKISEQRKVTLLSIGETLLIASENNKELWLPLSKTLPLTDAAVWPLQPTLAFGIKSMLDDSAPHYFQTVPTFSANAESSVPIM